MSAMCSAVNESVFPGTDSQLGGGGGSGADGLRNEPAFAESDEQNSTGLGKLWDSLSVLCSEAPSGSITW